MSNEIDQLGIAQLVNLEDFLRKINDGDLALRMKVRDGVLSTIWFLGVNAGLCTGTPTRS